ncbi:YpzG family protein [Fictibacillus phosphorivorans]|uniref:YpzG family protein n=1 Tax=Fictibacillus phosphorivorans TaxID=1221500 RepID=UPI002042629A|nr:YpzG family protein [Fictibacillus phosphorivorans]MCM3719983.1 YpzG family protein [Fictibacillus phosphorivorans]MCM3777660.1 YpzG family protein [Fictibacillus phosphorivorans]
MNKKEYFSSTRFNAKYTDPFHSPRANSKHAYNQVNGETQQALNNYVLEIQTRKRS